MPQRPKAYSYLRFSTPDQLKGDSLRRQTEAATAYAKSRNLDLDTELTFRDLGVSAFRGKNFVEGALGAFIEAVDSGKVEPGSYLLIESLDRLSRDRIMPALNRFADLLGKGVRIVTLSDGQEYDSESINNLTGLIVPLVTMARANEESEMKSRRLRAAWKQKKAEAATGDHVLTARVPAWLRVRDGKLEIDKGRAQVVRRIFDMAARGHGKAAIARKFNVEGVPTFGTANGWHASYIQKILRNHAVIGRYQPHRNTYEGGRKQRVPEGEPVEGYFPAVIEESLFYRVKHSKPGPSGKGDRLPRNVLSGLAFCARCGGSLHFVNKGKPPKGGEYLACDNARRFRTCGAPAVPYFETFANVMLRLDDFRDFDPDNKAGDERDREIDSFAAQIAETEESINRLLDTLERVQSEAAELRLEALEGKLAELKARKVEVQEKAAIVPEPSTSTASDLMTEYLALYEGRGIPQDKIEPMREVVAHISVEIRRSVERVEIEKGQPVRVIPRSSR